MHETLADTTQRAAGMLKIAEQRMLKAYPFHARFIATWQSQATTTMQTVGVTVRNSTILLFYNPAFVITCSFAQLVGVLHHEVNHLLFGHVFRDPTPFPDAWARTVAEEVTANEWIPEPLPGTPVVLAHFPQLPANEDTYTRYHRLARDQKQPSLSPKMPLSGPHSRGIVPELCPSGTITAQPTLLDDHTIWTDALASGNVGQMAVRVGIRTAAADLSQAAWQHMPPVLRRQVTRICAGDTPDSGYELLDIIGVN